MGPAGWCLFPLERRCLPMTGLRHEPQQGSLFNSCLVLRKNLPRYPFALHRMNLDEKGSADVSGLFRSSPSWFCQC